MKPLGMTLFEILIGILILSIGAGTLGWNVFRVVEKKSFSSAGDKIGVRLKSCRILAINTQSDWVVSFREGAEGYTLDASSLDSSLPFPMHSIQLGKGEILWNGKKSSDLSLFLSSTGEVFPTGRLSWKGPLEITWDLPALFALQEGKEGGPIRPEKGEDRERHTRFN